jgi:hypothetical protein
MGSRLVFAASVLGVIVVAVAVGIALDAPAPVMAIAAAFAGVALYRAYRNARRSGGANTRRPDLAAYPVRLSAQRVAPGKALQVTFSKANRAVHAEGLLCASPGALHFFPSQDKDAAKEWQGQVDGVSVERTLAETTVRVQSPQGPAQFVVDQTPDEVAAQLASYVPVEST